MYLSLMEDLCDSDDNQQNIMSKLSCLAEGVSATESPEKVSQNN